MNDWIHFLQNHRTDNLPSHVSLFGPKGKYMISPHGPEANTFWNLYNYLYTVEPLGFAETQHHQTYIPILVDVDIKVDHEKEHPKHLYNLDHVQTLVDIYQKNLREIIIDLREEDLICFLMEKPPYVQKRGSREFYKNGFHLHFPRIFMSRVNQENVLLSRIRLDLKKLQDSELPFGCTADSMIDKTYCRGQGQAWLLYGSRKEAAMDVYSLSKVFDETGKSSDEWWTYLYYFPLHNSIPITSKEDVDNHLPEIFSIRLEGKTVFMYEVRNDCIITANSMTSHQQLPPSKPTSNKKTVSIETDLSSADNIEKLVEDLLFILPPEYAQDRNNWMKIGWILYNIFHGKDVGYQLWTQFSKRCPDKFSEAVCQLEWSRMRIRNLSISSLRYIAKISNPVDYENVIRLHTQPFVEKCLKLEGTHNDVAWLLFHKYEAEFKCASINHRLWYQFHDHVWKTIEDGFILRSKISSDIVVEYEKIAKSYMNQISKTEDDQQVETWKKKINIVLKLIRQLKSCPFKNHVMKESMEIFYDEHFSKKLDSDPYLIGFQNGIYDLNKHEFREGFPDDYVSLKMNVRYNPDLSMQSEQVLQVIDFFEKIFPDKDVRDYFMNTTCDVFIGGNYNKIFQIWTGDGDNGKSITQSLFEQMLGPYSIKLPTSLISGKRTQSSAACPELVRAGNGVRLAMLQEPDQRDVINIGILKELSGNDTFYARGLFKEGQEITPMFKLVLICNDPPKIPVDDKATWNRIRVIPFEAIFSNDAPETFEEQLKQKIFPKDPLFKDRIPHMIEAMAWYLLERLKIKPKVIIEPEKVRMATEAYHKSNDIYGKFEDEYIRIDPDGSVDLADMYMTFKDWYRDSYPHSTIPPKNELTEYFSKKWGAFFIKNDRPNWYGRKMKIDSESAF